MLPRMHLIPGSATFVHVLACWCNNCTMHIATRVKRRYLLKLARQGSMLHCIALLCYIVRLGKGYDHAMN